MPIAKASGKVWQFFSGTNNRKVTKIRCATAMKLASKSLLRVPNCKHLHFLASVPTNTTVYYTLHDPLRQLTYNGNTNSLVKGLQNMHPCVCIVLY